MPTSPSGTLAAHHVWKRFRPDRRRSLLRDELQRLRSHGLRGSKTAWNWALRDVNFEVKPGGSLAFVGSNGSGKSTLLKILTEVMYPYAGSIQAVGRVGALIEVSSGIHPDLTGRENCYLYGSLLGLARSRVAAQFDAIVAFSGLEEAIDRQVKHYSSGMKMRLGFAVAAFLEPDILLVDEVLAVGDAAFQQRCLDRMRQVLAQGTTLVYVSHDLSTVEAMCSDAIWLKDGAVEAEGPTADVLAGYRRWVEQDAEGQEHPDRGITVTGIGVAGPDGGPVMSGSPVRLDIGLATTEPRAVVVHAGISQGPAAPLVLLSEPLDLTDRETALRCDVSSLPLASGRYYLWLAVYDGKDAEILNWRPVADFEVGGPPPEHAPKGIVRLAPIAVDAHWSVRPRPQLPERPPRSRVPDPPAEAALEPAQPGAKHEQRP